MSQNTIKVKDYEQIENEAAAGEVVTPGALVEQTGADEYSNHSTSGGSGAPVFALENANLGKTIAEDYSADDRLQLWTVQPGDVVFALLSKKGAAGSTAGSFLYSNGDGSFRGKGASETGSPLLETVEPQSEAEKDANGNWRIKAQLVSG